MRCWSASQEVLSYGLAPSGPLLWRHNWCDGASNHQTHDCLLNRLFKRRSKKTSKLCATGLCEGNSPVIGEFPAQMASNAENSPFDYVTMRQTATWTDEYQKFPGPYLRHRALMS